LDDERSVVRRINNPPYRKKSHRITLGIARRKV
jgi:hypothetical protein